MHADVCMYVLTCVCLCIFILRVYLSTYVSIHLYTHACKEGNNKTPTLRDTTNFLSTWEFPKIGDPTIVP